MAKKKEKEVVETKAVTEEKVETAVEEVKAEEGEGEGTETVEKKEGFFKKTWKYIVTGVTCAAVVQFYLQFAVNGFSTWVPKQRAAKVIAVGLHC